MVNFWVPEVWELVCKYNKYTQHVYTYVHASIGITLYIYIHILYPFVNRLFQFFGRQRVKLRFRATVQAPSSGESFLGPGSSDFDVA